VLDEPSSRALLEEELVKLRLHRRALDRLGDAVPRHHPMAALLRRSRAAADRCKASLVTANLHVAVAVAQHFRRSEIEPADLVQEGTIGLMRACDKFDPERGHRFGGYASFWVRQQIARALVEHEGTIRIPLQVSAARQRVARTQKKFSAAHGRSPSRSELLEATGLAEKVLEALRHLPLNPLRLHGTLADGETELMSGVADETVARADDTLEMARRNATVRGLLDKLTKREATILSLRYGLDGGDELTLREVAERFQLSRERVRRIEELALARLVALFRNAGVGEGIAA
jgi:RNA polymerase primary sigma factor